MECKKKLNLKLVPIEVVKLAELVDGYVVGGSVRDLLLNKKPNDYDIATPHPPDKVMEILRKNGYKVYPKGLEFGTVATHLDGVGEVEITTFRKEQYRMERGRKPIVSFSKSIYDDLERRDFTINALALDPKNGCVIDPFNGVEDLENGVVKFVGNPNERIREDPLRMIRACRFTAKLGFKLDEGSKKAIKENASQLERIASERVTMEFRKALGHFADFMNCLGETKQDRVIFGDVVDRMKEVKHDNRPPHYGESVFQHTLDVLKCLDEYEDFELSMAGLLHDFGKPDTVEKHDSKITFIGHEDVSYDYCQNIIGKNLRQISRREKKNICWLVKEHMKYNRRSSNIKSLVKYYADTRLNNIPYSLIDKQIKLSKCDMNPYAENGRRVAEVVYSVERPRGEQYLNVPPEERRNVIKSIIVQKSLEKIKQSSSSL